MAKLVEENHYQIDELINQNNEMTVRLDDAECFIGRLQLKIDKLERADLEPQLRQLQAELITEKHKDYRIEKLVRENQSLQTQLSKVLDDTYQQYNIDDWEDQLKLQQNIMNSQKAKLDEQTRQIKSKDNQLVELTVQTEELQKQLIALQHHNDTKLQPVSSESINNVSLESDPPTFTKLPVPSSLMMELEVDRLKVLLEEAEDKNQTLRSHEELLEAKLKKLQENFAAQVKQNKAYQARLFVCQVCH